MRAPRPPLQLSAVALEIARLKREVTKLKAETS